MDDRAVRERLHERQRKLMARLLPGYGRRIRTLEEHLYPGYRFGWRVAEAPALIDPELFGRDLDVARRLLDPYFTDVFRERYADHVPARFRRPDDSGWFPRFIATDYQRVWQEDRGTFRWCVPEIQSFPGNLFLKPAMLMACLPELPGIDERHLFLDPRFQSHADYTGFLRAHILGAHPPEDTIVLEVRPHQQVTHVDMFLAARHLRCAVVGLEDIRVDPATHEVHYTKATVIEDGAPRTRSFEPPRTARNILSRCLPEELDQLMDDPAERFTPAHAQALFQDSIRFDTARWVVHPQDFFVLSKATLVGNPHHDPPLRPLTRHLLDTLEGEGRALTDGVVKPAYAAGGRGLLGLGQDLDPKRLAELCDAGDGADPMDTQLWQERYGADPFDRSRIEGYRPTNAEDGDPVYHELRIMWAATSQPGSSSVELVPLTGLTRWSRVGFAANARHQITPFTGTHGILVTDLE